MTESISECSQYTRTLVDIGQMEMLMLGFPMLNNRVPAIGHYYIGKWEYVSPTVALIDMAQ